MNGFIFDFIAWVPIDLILIRNETAPIHLFRILKMLRIPKLVEILDVEKFKQILFAFFNEKLK